MTYVKHLVTKYCQNNLFFKASTLWRIKCVLLFVSLLEINPVFWFFRYNDFSTSGLFAFYSQNVYCFSKTLNDPQFNFTTFQAWKMKLYIMHQSIPAVPIPPGQPQCICSRCQSQGWGIRNFCRGLAGLSISIPLAAYVSRPHQGEFAHFFPKNANAQGLSREGWALLELADQCFRQTAPLRESRVVIREGPQKNGKRANLALYFYKAAGLTQP